MLRNASKKAVRLKSREATRDDPLRTFKGASHLPKIDSGVPSDVGKNKPIPTVVALQKILSDQPGNAHTQKQAVRYAREIMSRLRYHGLQRTEGEQERTSSSDEHRNICQNSP
ncbi:hypothetical protein ABT117_15710 [Streptomyces sp. NPDC002262]|uniref:hypothetical protein n=1 Tax=Streptomyces sp. NPDC002262 TaxID=3154414 RepID=UPI00332D6DD1